MDYCAGAPRARTWEPRVSRRSDGVGSGVTLGRAARAVQPTGETMADAMTVALKERLDRERRQRGGAARLRRMRAIAERSAMLLHEGDPPIDHGSDRNKLRLDDRTFRRITVITLRLIHLREYRSAMARLVLSHA